MPQRLARLKRQPRGGIPAEPSLRRVLQEVLAGTTESAQPASSTAGSGAPASVEAHARDSSEP